MASHFRKAPALIALTAAMLAQQPATIKVTTRLVQVSVVAHNRKGEPVEDLTKDDFVLFERGKPQKISLFQMDSRKPQVKSINSLPPNIFSNRASRQADTPNSVTVILLDGLNTRFQDQIQAKRQLLKFLKQIKPGDQVALYALGSNLKILHDFTGDPAHLTNALAKFGARISGELSAADPTPPDPTGNDELDQFLQDADHLVSDFYNVNRIKFTLEAMEAIANHLSGLPGRKNLVWFSGGFPFTLGLDLDEYSNDPRFERRTFSEEAERTIRAMNNAGIAIYPVDARGLIGLPASFSAASRTPPITPSRNGLPKIVSLSPKNLDTMEILASGTGGRAFYNTNDLEGAIRKAVDDSLVTYTLGYYSSAEDWDGKFHKLKVEIKRKGVDIRYRKGYVALKEQATTDRERDAILREAIRSPLEATGIGIALRTDPSEKPKEGTLRLGLQIGAQDLTLEPVTLQGEQRWSGKIDVVYAQKAADGTTVTSVTETINMNLTQPNYEKLVKSGILMMKYITPDPKAYQIRVIVFDRPSGGIGSIHVPLKAKASL